MGRGVRLQTGGKRKRGTSIPAGGRIVGKARRRKKNIPRKW